MTENICPYLGSLGDPLSCTTSATEDNLCYATGEGDLITKVHQKKYCLSGKMTGCPQFPVESTLSSFSTATPAMASGSAAKPKPNRQAPGRSSYRGPRRLVEEDDDRLEAMPLAVEAGEDFDVLAADRHSGPEDAYFDAVHGGVGPLGDETPEDFYFDDLDKANAAAAAAQRQSVREEPSNTSGRTVLIDPDEVKGAKKGRSTPSSSPRGEGAAPARPVAAPAAPTSMRPPDKPFYAAPAESPVAPRTPPASASAAAALYDNTAVLPTVQRPPVAPTPAAETKIDLGLPEPAQPVKPAKKIGRPEEKPPRKNYAGADPSWMARQIAEQAKPTPAVSTTESPRPMPTVRPAPALVPNPARIKAPVATVTQNVQSFPEQLPPLAAKPRRSRMLLYLSLSTGLLAILLVCLGTILMRSNLLASGPNLVASIAATPTAVMGALAVPMETATQPQINPTATAVVTLVATATPAATSVNDMATPDAAAETATATVTPAPATETASLSATATAKSTATPAPSSTATPAPSSTATPTPSSTATATPSATATATPSATATPAPSATANVAASAVQNPSATPLPSATPTIATTATTAPTNSPTDTPSATASPALTNPPASAGTHVVQGGDTPYDIAGRYGISVAALMAANPGLDARLMRVGQQLNIPAAGAEPATPAPAATAPAIASPAVSAYVVKGGDTLGGIAAELGLDATDLLQANPGLNPQRLRIGQEIRVPTAGGPVPPAVAVAVAAATSPAPTPVQPPTVHVVKTGETLLGIAIRYNLTTEDLMAANPRLDAQFLQIGQEIKISGGSAPSVAASPGTPAAPSAPAAVQAGLAPARIVAPSIKLEANVLPISTRKDLQGGIVALAWDEPDAAAGFHTDSALPGQTGNVVISGANNGKGEVFRSISDLKEGDEVQVFAGDKSYQYRVERVLMMPDKYISAEKRRANDAWLSPTSDSRLTLVSYGPYPTAAQRVVVVARAVAAP